MRSVSSQQKANNSTEAKKQSDLGRLGPQPAPQHFQYRQPPVPARSTAMPVRRRRWRLWELLLRPNRPPRQPPASVPGTGAGPWRTAALWSRCAAASWRHRCCRCCCCCPCAAAGASRLRQQNEACYGWTTLSQCAHRSRSLSSLCVLKLKLIMSVCCATLHVSISNEELQRMPRNLLHAGFLLLTGACVDSSCIAPEATRCMKGVLSDSGMLPMYCSLRACLRPRM